MTSTDQPPIQSAPEGTTTSARHPAVGVKDPGPGDQHKDRDQPTDSADRPPWPWQLAVAGVLLTLFTVMVVVLIVAADKPDGQWKNLVFVFGAVEAPVFTAVGWVFGREVHRAEAVASKQDAAEAKRDATASRLEAETNARLAAQSESKASQLATGARIAVAADNGGPTRRGPAGGDVGFGTGGQDGTAGSAALLELLAVADELVPPPARRAGN